ncbi:MAG TPA: hypothetical protein VGL77_01920 [Armatimonadota bacterium]|jgi:hypothetical protein
MHNAAVAADEDPDRLSFIHTVRILRRKLPQLVLLSLLTPPALPPVGPMLASDVQDVMQRAVSSGLQTLIPTPDKEHAVDYDL